MSDHYYSKQPESEIKQSTAAMTLKGHGLTFTMSTGVFSKRGIDYGTKTLIEAFCAPAISGDLLDLGCGYGPIGIVMAKEYPDRRVTMVDINERAVELASRNVMENNVLNAEIKQSDGFENLENRIFAGIITNPPIRAGKKTVHRMMELSYDHLAENGELWAVIQKKQGAPSLMKFLEGFFKETEVVSRSKGYYVIRAIKSSD